MSRNAGFSYLPVALALALGACGTTRSTLTEAPPPSRGPRALERCVGHTDFQVGAGLYDITGPAAQVLMMGYVKAGQVDAGIHLRLRSRAFVIASPCNGQRVVFVSADLVHVYQAVKQEVVRRLRERYGDLYASDNVLLSATHTHSGPGGFSHDALYNLTFAGVPFLGYVPQNFEAVAEGIFQSIVRAHDNLAPGRILLATGELRGASANRSPGAYALDPREERSRYRDDVDTRMTLLRLEADTGGGSMTPVGTVNWFAVHATSMSNENKLISGDNKGLASYIFEQRLGTRYTTPKTFVAAFAQSNEGDVTPNVYGGLGGRGMGDVAATRESGERQFQKAWELYSDASARPVTGGVDFRLAYVKLDDVAVRPEWADGQARHTCKAALGISMLAGAEDGPGIGEEGVSCTDKDHALARLLCSPRGETCQAEKPVVLEMGREKPVMSPNVLPVQILTVGNVAMVAVPFEMTTMAGRRLRETVHARLAPRGVDTVVIAGLSNSYAGYLATREEYARQDYEGASTHFGPWTLAALQQEFARVAEAMSAGAEVELGPIPKDPGELKTADLPDRPDALPDGVRFGQVVEDRDARDTYTPGQTVSVTFWGGLPRNGLRTEGSFLEVQRQDTAGAWQPVAYDWDWETQYHWQRYPCPPRGACSQATVVWNIPDSAEPGTYRLQHDGDWRDDHGKVHPYTGVSREFTVRAE